MIFAVLLTARFGHSDRRHLRRAGQGFDAGDQSAILFLRQPGHPRQQECFTPLWTQADDLPVRHFSPAGIAQQSEAVGRFIEHLPGINTEAQLVLLDL